MGPYTTVEKIKAIFTTERLASYLVSDADPVIQAAIDSATAQMDVYLSRWYSNPLDDSNLTTEQATQLAAMIEEFANAIVLYNLIPLGSSGVPDGVKIAYDRVMSRLNDLLKSRWQLPYLTPRVVPAFQMIGDVPNTLTPAFFTRSRFQS